ncbi:UDP-glucose iridoid glucosyltransferase-like isoform X2 [Durio zibethinus]|uniref:UDP-glucose iridoid glucosyltransferase-like isoform X2 n=1 Tax=Durio zibethinus TaxID=66656 RepID=A0A6P5ZIV9_DURZI|nr:UDP-glucose iridoid glucosyltransferase-like isoform X2 [Durio zibethinus]
MEKEGKKAGRWVLVLYPFQGHINPMLQLATILHSKGFSIIIVHPEFNSPNPSNHPEFTFRPIPDKLSESNVSLGDFANLVLTLNKHCLAPFQQCMNQILHEKDSTDHVAGIIYDTLSYFAQSVADDLRLPGISVRTSAAATMLVFAVFPNPDKEDSISENQTLEVDLQILQLQQLLASILRNPTDAMSKLRTEVIHATKSSSAIIVNTMDFLEEAVLSKIKEYFPSPIFPVGPFHKLAATRSSSLLKEETNCLSWLDKQALKSVLYVSFGSMATIDEQELIETAWGLANSELPFLWVIRPGLVRGSEWIELLPKDFLDRVGERGCIVKWAPQRKVLAHSAVGGFWSHCGWNSTLESISEGVPMLCRPFVGDQLLDSKYICHVWKVGLELENNNLERGKIEEAIKRLMLDVEGENVRKNAMNLKEKTELSLTEGGSSSNYLNDLVKHISSN